MFRAKLRAELAQLALRFDALRRRLSRADDRMSLLEARIEKLEKEASDR